MPQIETREKFAWRPILTTGGKWIWWCRYVKLMKIYWGPVGEDPVVDAEFYTEGEWLLKILSGEYEPNTKQPFRRPPPPMPMPRKKS